MIYIGLDVHKRNIAACMISDSGKPIRMIELSDRSGLNEMAESLNG